MLTFVLAPRFSFKTNQMIHVNEKPPPTVAATDIRYHNTFSVCICWYTKCVCVCANMQSCKVELYNELVQMHIHTHTHEKNYISNQISFLLFHTPF